MSQNDEMSRYKYSFKVAYNIYCYLRKYNSPEALLEISKSVIPHNEFEYFLFIVVISAATTSEYTYIDNDDDRKKVFNGAYLYLEKHIKTCHINNEWSKTLEKLNPRSLEYGLVCACYILFGEIKEKRKQLLVSIEEDIMKKMV